MIFANVSRTPCHLSNAGVCSSTNSMLPDMSTRKTTRFGQVIPGKAIVRLRRACADDLVCRCSFPFQCARPRDGRK